MKRITAHTNLFKWEEWSKFSGMKIKEETCMVLHRSRTPQTQKEERSGQCSKPTTGVPHRLDKRQQYHIARKKKQILVYSVLGRFLMVPSLSVLILWSPKSILVTSILHTRCTLLLNPLANLGSHPLSPVKYEVEWYCLGWGVLKRLIVLWSW